ncbi:MAG TPA: YdeI/OmpD-associated family protein [Candidatus Krumholzibacteria bacterium]|nr:YdeI/OmpD-associated family protein [Candidatus Krumholzibacteria bacterium]HPD73088.1 YdeI/OmpD-associated family protein [Candidatus Krumholzibacteria bacterium]HRY41888.1 YdeI/OmpD-associated family protein [Candidatus Krumholzibacteria bacterium]
MTKPVPDVDTYIANAPEFARPILEKIRAAFHAGCPELEERIKWGVPSFEYKGMLGGMSAFTQHVSFGFWKSRLMENFARDLGAEPAASLMRVHVRSVADLPPKKVLVAFVREAKRLNDEGIKEPARAPARSPRKLVIPADLKRALASDAKARRTFESFPPGQQREYVEWITSAKREATRAERVATAVAWLAEGKRRNWKYERRSGSA